MTGEREWPACATYPNLGCVCRSALGQNKTTCTRKRTGDLTPLWTVARSRVESICDAYETLTPDNVPLDVVDADDYLRGATDAARAVQAAL